MGRRPNDEKIEVVNIRMVKEPSIYSTEKIRTPDDVLRVIANELATYDREVFAVLNLKTNGQPINLNICSVGTLDASVVSPREVFKSCILSNSAAFIAIHNHPSGSVTPSLEDKDVTKRLLSCSELLGVKMLDHIIIGGETGDMYSFKSDGLLDQLRPVIWQTRMILLLRSWSISGLSISMITGKRNGPKRSMLLRGTAESRRSM